MRSRLSPNRRRSSTKPDFARVAGRYDELRPADENWWELFELLVREGDLVGRRVLDVGCGTGRAAAALAERGSRVWGVEPEPEMAALARQRLSTVKVAPAERLPFKDGWFDRVLMWLVVHLVDRPRAFAEAARVLAPDGRLAIATFHWDYFEDHWLGGFFPSLEKIDRARFSKTDDLVRELEAAGFGSVSHTRLGQRSSVDREWALQRVREHYVSPLQLLDENEYRAGLERMEQELPEAVEYTLEWLVAVAHKTPD
jgi:ubiquinone/menaquinone biosynthesis C-methylase UbiE